MGKQKLTIEESRLADILRQEILQDAQNIVKPDLKQKDLSNF